MNKIKVNFIYNVMYQILTILVPIVTTPYIARNLGSTSLGVFSFTTANVSYFVLIANLGFGIYGQNEISKIQSEKDKISKFVWNMFIIKCTFSVFILSIYYFICIYFLNEYLNIYLILSIQIISSIFDFTWFYMGLENFKIIVIRNIIIKIISVLLIFILIHRPSDLFIYVLIIVLGGLVSNLIILPEVINHVKPKPVKLCEIRNIFVNSIILFIPTIAMNIYTNLNKTFVGILTNKENVAFFVQSDNLIKLLLAVITSLGTVMMPHITNLVSKKRLAESENLIYKSFRIMTFISVPIIIEMCFTSSRFISFFLGSTYMVTGNLLKIESIIIILIAWTNVLGTQFLIPMGKFKAFSISVSLPAVFSLILTPFLIFKFDVYGAVFSVVIIEGIVFIMQLYLCRNNLKLFKLFEEGWKIISSGLVMIISLIIFNELTIIKSNVEYLIYNITLGLIVYIFCIYILKTTILDGFFKSIKK